MKNQRKKVLALLIIFIFSTNILSAGFFQTPGSTITFQGVLYENDEPVDGAVDLTFSIADPAWTETHTGVQVANGLYSVILGSQNAFPEVLFTTGTPVLKISIGSTEIASVDLHAPYISEEIISQNLPSRIIIDSPEIAGDTAVSFSVSGDDYIRGLQVDMTGTGTKYAIRANAISNAGDSGWKVGVISLTIGEGDGNHTGVYGQAFGTGQFNNGVTGVAAGTGNGATGYGTGSYNVGLLGFGYDNPWGNIGVEGRAIGNTGQDNIGVIGIAMAGDSTDTSIENKAVLGRAEGKGINKAIMGIASDGVENWAGWFEGDVNVTGQLLVNGSPLEGSGPVPGTGIQITNPDSQLRGEISYFEPNDAGSLVLYGANDSTKVLLGSSNEGYGGGLWLYDSLRNVGTQLRVSPKGRGNLFTRNENHQNVGWFGGLDNDGFVRTTSYDENEAFSGAALVGSFTDGKLPEFFLEGSREADLGLARLKLVEVGSEEAGSLELNRSNGGGSFTVNIVNDPANNDPTGFGAEIFLNGTNTPNFQIGGQPWENNDLGFLAMYGRTGNGNGWYHSNATLIVGTDDVHDWGNFSLYKSNIAGFTNQEMISMTASDGSISAVGDISSDGSIHAVVAMNAPVFNTTSDKRFKKNVKSIDNALAKTRELSGYTYNWNALAKKQKGLTGEKEQVGVLAQELEEVFPQLVNTDDEGFKSVNYAALTAVLIEAIKELSSELNTVKTENSQLKSAFQKTASLEARINLIEKLLNGKGEAEEQTTASE